VTNRKDLIEELKKINLRRINFDVNEICLMKSELAKEGQRYKVIGKIKLVD